jgi:hypothetical protein
MFNLKNRVDPLDPLNIFLEKYAAAAKLGRTKSGPGHCFSGPAVPHVVPRYK